jgi:hypothetical protein
MLATAGTADGVLACCAQPAVAADTGARTSDLSMSVSGQGCDILRFNVQAAVPAAPAGCA